MQQYLKIPYKANCYGVLAVGICVSSKEEVGPQKVWETIT